MTVLFLFIPDTALRDAVVEQIAAARLAEARVADSAQALLKQSEGEADAVIVIDEAGDKKHAELLQELPARLNRPVVLALGGTEEIDGVSESFAKPLRLGHLVTRLRYYLETAPLLRDRNVAFGSYQLEPQNRRIIGGKNGAPIRLTEKETALLVFLAQSAAPATRQDILAAVWGYDERIDTHTLETHIYQLRRKLDGDGDSGWLINEAGAYRLARSPG